MDVLRRIHKLRKHVEAEARSEFVAAERAWQAQQAALAETTDAMARVRAERSDDPDELARDQAWLLRMEMQRRRTEGTVVERQGEVVRRREVLVGAAREARVVELGAEAEEERERTDEVVRTQRALDEVGLGAWRRRNA